MPPNDQVAAHVAELDSFIARLSTAHEGLLADVKSLKDTIIRLDSTQGQINAEDQRLLTEARTKVETMVTRFEALNEMTPPEETPPEATDTPPTPTPPAGGGTSQPPRTAAPTGGMTGGGPTPTA